MTVVGKNERGERLVTGVFRYIYEHGVPLEVLLKELKKRNCVVDWINFYTCAYLSGWHADSIINRIHHAVNVVYGKKAGAQVVKELM
ncbi:MAG: hypothetical protein GY868_13780 [Deltaproteobacteria bacterium]|nr:hypothetical protein [Deltaproteobacteria bacterium]